ncbi:MAG: FtsX-like permease family protein [Lachnospiraceae bacterium]|nr:FtsX-like permease family protein [Lachnospiraceae bacterium]
MNIFHKVTLQILKQNKMRTIVTIIGIILSASMITAVTTLASSLQNYLLENTIYTDGDWHGSAISANKELLKTLEESKEVESLVYAKELGYAIVDDCQNEYKPYLYIIEAGTAFQETMPIHITGGRYPSSENEILLPDHLAENGGVIYRVGDTITLEIGNRMTDGYQLNQYNPYSYNEKVELQRERERQEQETLNEEELNQKAEDSNTMDMESQMQEELESNQELQEELQANQQEKLEIENISKEEIAVRETKTYTVVGFYERPPFENYSAPGYTAIVFPQISTLKKENLLEDNMILKEDRISEDIAKSKNDSVSQETSASEMNFRYNIYFKLKNSKDIFEFTDKIQKSDDTGVVSSTQNSDLLLYLGVSGYEGFYTVLYGLASIVIGLIMFGSVSLIYNAFSISVSERTKQFGLLSSIGATKKQLQKMVFFEAFVVSVIGIPIGIFAGVLGIGVTLFFIGNRFISIGAFSVPLTLCVSPMAIITAGIVALITIFISAWIPSQRATKVTAVEAIRQNTDIKLEKRKKKQENRTQTSGTTWSQKLMYRLFGLSGMIANKYYKRSKKKYRATVISLFMSIVLFVSTSAFTQYLTKAVTEGFDTEGYDITYAHNPLDYTNKQVPRLLSHEELAQLIADCEGVMENAYTDEWSQHLTIKKEYIHKDYLEYNEELNQIVSEINANEIIKTDTVADTKNKKETNTEQIQVYFGMVFVDDENFKQLLKENNLSEEVFMNPENPLAVAFDGETAFDYGLEKYYTYNVLNTEECEVVYTKGETQFTLKSGKLLHERPYYINLNTHLVFVYPYSMIKEVIGEDPNIGYGRHYILSDNHTASYQAIRKVLVEHGLNKNVLYDEAERLEENRNLVMIMNVFSYGFIVLISLIAAANVFNTISTNISLRRREFAMLKSVGMSNKELNRMMNFECILYGSRALLYGLPVSGVITWFIYKIVSDGFETGFHLPWTAIGIATLSVFLVVFATMMYSMRKIKADNPIDALKNENL